MDRVNTDRDNTDPDITDRDTTDRGNTGRRARLGHTLDVRYVILLSTATAPTSRRMMGAAAVPFVSINRIFYLLRIIFYKRIRVLYESNFFSNLPIGTW